MILKAPMSTKEIEFVVKVFHTHIQIPVTIMASLVNTTKYFIKNINSIKCFQKVEKNGIISAHVIKPVLP